MVLTFMMKIKISYGWVVWDIVKTENKSIEKEFIKKLSKYGVEFDNYSGKPEVNFDDCGWESMCAIFNLKIK